MRYPESGASCMAQLTLSILLSLFFLESHMPLIPVVVIPICLAALTTP